MTSEDTRNRLSGGQHLFGQHKLVKHFRLSRNGAETTSDDNLEASLLLPINFSYGGNKAEIMHLSQAAGVLSASTQSRLEFAAKVLSVRMPQQELSQSMGVGSHVKGLVGANTHEGATGDISHRVPAGLSRSDTHRRQTTHDRGGIVDVNEVQLKI